jgi:hypothetical protein
MATLHIYQTFDAWFDAVSDIDPEAIAAPYRFTLGDIDLTAPGRCINDALAWVRIHT